jgi:hypothetical protein
MHEDIRHFKNKKRNVCNLQLMELETNSRMKNIRDLCRGINDYKKGYQPRNNIVKDEKCDLFADSHSILARWKNHFSQILNVRGINDVRQTDIHTAGPLVPEPSAFGCEMAIEKLKRHKSPYIDPIPAKCNKAGSSKIPSEVHQLINSIGNNEQLPEGWKESITVPVNKKGGRKVVIKWAYHFCQLRKKFYPTSCCQG